MVDAHPKGDSATVNTLGRPETIDRHGILSVFACKCLKHLAKRYGVFLIKIVKNDPMPTRGHFESTRADRDTSQRRTISRAVEPMP